jgi:hypothetical protein
VTDAAAMSECCYRDVCAMYVGSMNGNKSDLALVGLSPSPAFGGCDDGEGGQHTGRPS